MKILVTGGNGFLGKSLLKNLQSCGIYETFSPRSRNFDLTNPKQTITWWKNVQHTGK